jgi:hypothetical protein
MKKALAVLFVVMAFSFAAQAQSYKSAIGLRGGDPSGITFKTFVNSVNAIELIAGSGYFGHNLNLSAYYEWQKPTDWAPNLDWFIGPGAHIGFWNTTYQDEYNTNLVIGIDGIIGLEYTFDDIPLNLGVGAGPTFNLTEGPGWWYWNGGISIKYVF